MSNATFTLSTYYAFDHLDRLYVKDSVGNGYDHVDNDACRIVVEKVARNTTTITASLDAVRELQADAEYQAEFSDEPTYRQLARRVVARCKAVLASAEQDVAAKFLSDHVYIISVKI